MYKRLLASVVGAFIWNRIIDNNKNSLNLIIPEYDGSLLDCLYELLPNYCCSNNYSNVRFIITSKDVGKIVSSWNIDHCIVYITNIKMTYLFNYALLTCNQVSFLRQKNVRIVSFDEQFAGQLRKIHSSELVSIQKLVKEKILTWGG